MAKVIDYVKRCHTVFETPITLAPDATIADALSLIHKRAHGAVVVVDNGTPVGVFTESDGDGFDRFTQLANVMSSTKPAHPPPRHRPGHSVRPSGPQPAPGCSRRGR